MARGTIDEYSIDSAYVTVKFDTRGPVGGNHLVTVANTQAIDPSQEWSVNRWFFFDEFSEDRARSFATAIVEDDEYRRASLSREAHWANVVDTYLDASRDIRRYFEDAGVRGADAKDEVGTKEFYQAKDARDEICERLYKGIKKRIKQPDRLEDDAVELEGFIDARKNEAFQWLRAHEYIDEYP